MFLFNSSLLMAALMGAQPIDKKELFKPNLYLVRAKALSFSYEDGGQAHCIFEIEHVYVGPDSLNGERFDARGGLPSPMFAQFGYWTGSEIKKGEVSIWWITERPSEKADGPAVKQKAKETRLVSAENNPKTANEVPFPPVRQTVHNATDSDDEKTKEEVRKDGQWFNYIEKCSMDMEQLYHASSEKRLDLLKELGRRDRPLLQGWCLGKLKSVLSQADYVAYLTDLATTATLHLLIEYEVDCQLCDLSPAWRSSERRLKFFRRWVNGKLTEGESESEENDILYILVRVNYDDFAYPTFLRLMIDGLTTDRRSEDFKKRLLDVRDFSLKDLTSIDDGFAYLTSQVRKANPNRRLAAARLLTHFVPLCKAQETTVKALLDDPAYKSVASPLSEALQQTALVLDGLCGKDGPKWELEEEKFLWVRLLELAPAPQAVRFIREQVRPSPAVDPARVRQFVSDLDNDSFRRREEASRRLVAMGLETEPILEAALGRTKSAEVRRRLDSLLAQFKVERTITLRAIPILARLRIAEARSLLQKLASGSKNSPITREAKKALDSIEKPEAGKKGGQD